MQSDSKPRGPAAYADCAHLAVHQSVYSGGTNGKAHPKYVHLSASDCATAGERQVHHTSADCVVVWRCIHMSACHVVDCSYAPHSIYGLRISQSTVCQAHMSKLVRITCSKTVRSSGSQHSRILSQVCFSSCFRFEFVVLGHRLPVESQVCKDFN